MKIHDRGNNYHNYLEHGFGLEIKAHYKDHTGEIYFWQMAMDGEFIASGRSKEDFIDALNYFINRFKLKKSGKATTDLMVIYVDNLAKIKGFFRQWMTEGNEDFEHLYIQLLDYFEFRDITRWKDLSDAKEISIYAKYLVDNLFIPDKYWYITPNQVPRRQIAKACKKSEDSTAKNIYPTSYNQYKLFRKALFGGIVFVPYKNLVIDEPIICLDLTSAYIYDLLIEKHCITKFKLVNHNNWEYYKESLVKASIGKYHIHYYCNSNKIHCFKDLEDKNYECGEYVVDSILTDVDLNTLFNLATIIDISCEWLYECDLGDLPKYLLDECVRQYIKKVELKGDEEAYNLQKPIVNGIFGDCIRNYDEKTFNHNMKYASLAPQWGIWCTSYARKNLLKLATKVTGWIYSDTDSIYCFDTPENRQLMKEYNDEVDIKLQAFCKKYGYDYEKLKDLGKFKIEKEITKFKALTQKVYMYKTKKGEFKLVAAGLNQQTITVNENLFNQKKLDYGSRLFKVITDNSYYEEWKHGDDLFIYQMMELAQLPTQY